MRAIARVLVVAALGAVLATSCPATSGTAATASKLRADLAALVYGPARQSVHVMHLIRGHRRGELAYFVTVRGRATAARGRTLGRLGARVLQRYGVVDAFSVASRRAVVSRVAALPWVVRLLPVELVHAQVDEPLADQLRSSSSDVGATTLWNQGIVGSGVRIAVIDTGLDPLQQDLDDLDFRHWSVGGVPKVVAQRNFTNGGCGLGVTDGHGHGTHVAGIAAGTGEGSPLDAADNGKYVGIAPGATLGIAKALDDTGNGLNSDLLKAMEWAASPSTTQVCTDGPLPVYGLGADIVNMSLASEARPARLDSSNDADMVSLTLNRLAARYGTLFVVAVGNSGPYIGSALESPASAAQALSVGATAKDYDVNHDDTYSGDSCAGWRHPYSPPEDNDCKNGVGDQPPSLSSLSSRGPTGDLWLRPDVVAPGYNIVAPQATAGTAIASNDLNIGTRSDPLYATASGTSMAAPTVAGASALLLQAYRATYGRDPVGGSGIPGLQARRYALIRAALMNTAGANLYEARWILTNDLQTRLDCTVFTDPLIPLFCSFPATLIDSQAGSSTLYEVRNGAADPYVGPLGEGAGKIDVVRASAALRSGVVVYSTASGTGADAGTGPRDLQGTWQVGAIRAGSTASQSFVLHAAPGVAPLSVTFAFTSGNPSDGSRAITSPWSISLKGPTPVRIQKAGEATVNLTIGVPSTAAPGNYTGALILRVSNGQVLRVPIYAAVALHDSNLVAANAPGPQAKVTSALDVFAKGDTVWPSVGGQTVSGALSDWLVYPVELAAGLTRARFAVWDTATDPATETYDLYLYDANLNYEASTHPFASPGVTDVVANSGRAVSSQGAPQVLTVSAPRAGRHYLVVSRARIGGVCPCTGDFGSFGLTLDETTTP
jgi:subtilisin family serine protease